MTNATIWTPGTQPLKDAQNTIGWEKFTPPAGTETLTFTKFTYTMGAGSILLFKNGEILTPVMDYQELSTSSIALTLDSVEDDWYLVIGFIRIVNVDEVTEDALEDIASIILGEHAADPVVDNLGNPLIPGAVYYNTVTEKSRVFVGPNVTDWTDLVQEIIIGTLPANQVTMAPVAGLVAEDVQAAVEEIVSTYQPALESGVNIKTVAGKTLVGSGNVALVKGDVGLGSVDNTSDADKPVSTAQAAALATKGGLTANNTWTGGNAGTPTALPATTGTVTLPLAAANNWAGTLTGNITLANPSTIPVGQSGAVILTNGATPYTIAYGSYWKASGGIPSALTAVAGAVDVLVYYVKSATEIVYRIEKDVK